MIQVDESDPVGELQPSFPYRDVQIRRGVDMKELYDLQSEIGRGKFGTVYRCREKGTGLELAAKFVGTPRKEDRRSVEREVDIMRALQHPRLIQLYDAFDNNKVMCVVLELIEGGELFERVIDDDFLLTEKSCTVFMRQICEGIEFIHGQNILHLDMKPENILCLTKAGNRIKIIDFGLARKFDPHKKLQVLFGTPEFVAPEVVNFDQIGFGTDMWSVGVICYVLLSGLSPFMGSTDIETMANVTVAKYDFDDQVFNDISEDAKDFIRKLLLKDRDFRLAASECLSHSWLRRKPRPVTEELDGSKDNLRFFVERWSEHPNSPYLFDISSHVISPCLLSELDPVPSHLSMRGNSPSPCGSLSSSSPDSVMDQPTQDPPTLFRYTLEPSPPQPIPSPKYHLERLQTFERRASDSSCIMRNNNDTAGRVNLADEIKKLSDKLFQMASLHVPTANFTSNTHKVGLSSPGFLSPASTAAVHSSIPLLSRGAGSAWEDSSDGVKRTKFRVSNLNRDVPIGLPSGAGNMLRFSSTCSSRTSSDNLTSSTCSTTPSSPEPDPGADRTKDLLLHLLNKWDDKQVEQQPANQGCRKASISLEWSEQESLGQRTMTSLASYFQSSRTTNVDKTRSVVPP